MLSANAPLHFLTGCALLPLAFLHHGLRVKPLPTLLWFGFYHSQEHSSVYESEVLGPPGQSLCELWLHNYLWIGFLCQVRMTAWNKFPPSFALISEALALRWFNRQDSCYL